MTFEHLPNPEEMREALGLPRELRFREGPAPRPPVVEEIRALHQGRLEEETALEVRSMIALYRDWYEADRQVLQEELAKIDWAALADEGPQVTTTRAGVMDQAANLVEGLKIFARAVLLPDFAYRPAAAAAASEETARGEVETQLGTVRWRITDDHGDCLLRLGSRSMDLEGARIRVQMGELERQVALKQIVPGQLGAELAISADERSNLPSGTELVLEILAD